MNFQAELYQEALRLVGSRGARSEIQDGHEKVIKVTFEQYELWIYEDGADVQGPSTDKRFEIYDFDDLGRLKQSVLAFLEKLLTA